VKDGKIRVDYDLTNVRPKWIHNPHLYLTHPGRFNPGAWFVYFPTLIEREIPLQTLKGSVEVPASLLEGGGIYGIGIQYYTPDMYPDPQTVFGLFTDFAYIRVQPQTASSERPLPPSLQADGSGPVHFLAVPYHGSFQVSWDVSNVRGANGAELEFSGAG